MIHLPYSYKSDNTYRVVVTQQTLPATDFERIEDIAADAIGHARDAVASLDAFGSAASHAAVANIRDLRRRVEARDVLSEDFRITVQNLLRDLARIDVPDDEAKAYDRACCQLRDALNLSLRVCDLLAAEKALSRRMQAGR